MFVLVFRLEQMKGALPFKWSVAVVKKSTHFKISINTSDYVNYCELN
jgi:hypothetical protein